MNSSGVPVWKYDDDVSGYDPFLYLDYFIRESRPCIILLKSGDKSYHYVVVVGYDKEDDVYLLADPWGVFRWINKTELDTQWSFRENSGTLKGSFLSTVIESYANPFTLIVPKSRPTSHYLGYWSQMKGEFISGTDKFGGNVRSWERTWNFEDDFDFVVASSRELFSSTGTATFLGYEKEDSKSVKLWGKIEDGWALRGRMWVVARTYSLDDPNPPPPPRADPHSFSLSGLSNSITSGESRTLSVFVKSSSNKPVQGVKVEFRDSNDTEISFSSLNRTTDNNGRATTTMHTGSEGSADFVVDVYNHSGSKVLSRLYKLTVVPWIKEFSPRRVTIHSDYSFWNCRSKQEKSRTIDLTSRVIQSTIRVSGKAHLGDAAGLDRWSWVDSNTIKVVAWLRKHCVEKNSITITVTGKYKGTNDSRKANGAPTLTPEIDTLSLYWEDLSQVPFKNQLLPNYPNPFNPETWIPYQLSEPAEVQISIYSSDGTLVRTISMGYQASGLYQNRNRAAYWNGENEWGESVASGLYFYTLTAGEFTETKKMLILK
ncbi:T9SS type A sorting domain-containing protein [Candidatus Poribacteria bacterium]|nr:T9SS type A sorting domain-containing protein [Candidatus Poribacteria bacterium]